MRVRVPQVPKHSTNAFFLPLRPSVVCRGVVALRAEPSTAVLKQTDARESEAAPVHALEQTEDKVASEIRQPSAPEADAHDAPHLAGASASHSRWRNARQNAHEAKDKPILERHQFRCKVGDVVVGKVVFSGDKGAKVDLLDYPGVMGFMPADRGPFATASHSHERQTWRPRIAVGTTRQFQVLSIPQVMEVNGKGPLLGCEALDLSILWHRLGQVFEECTVNRELMTVRVHGSSRGGLLCSLCGLRGFIPISHIPKPSSETWWDQESLEAQYKGRNVKVAMLEMKRDRNTFTCSIRNAEATRALRSIRVGSLIWGTVRLVRNYGAFIAIDDTNESALLHIGNISWERVYDIEDHLAVGDRVRAVVIGMDEDHSRISVSTKDLEVTPGDMLINKEEVYENAEEGVKPFLQHVADWEAQTAARQSEQDGIDNVSDTMEADDFRK